MERTLPFRSMTAAPKGPPWPRRTPLRASANVMRKSCSSFFLERVIWIKIKEKRAKKKPPIRIGGVVSRAGRGWRGAGDGQGAIVEGGDRNDRFARLDEGHDDLVADARERQLRREPCGAGEDHPPLLQMKGVGGLLVARFYREPIGG